MGKFSGTTSSGGEADVNSQYKKAKDNAGSGQRNSDRTTGWGAHRLRCPRGLLISAAMAMAAFVLLPAASQAQQRIAFASARTSMVTVTVGKSQDVRTDQSFVDITVGDPDVADVNPADRSCAVDSRQEDRHDTRHGLRPGQEAGRHIRRRGVLRHLAAVERDRAFHRRRHQGVFGQRPHHAERHVAGRRDARSGRS